MAVAICGALLTNCPDKYKDVGRFPNVFLNCTYTQSTVVIGYALGTAVPNALDTGYV